MLPCTIFRHFAGSLCLLTALSCFAQDKPRLKNEQLLAEAAAVNGLGDSDARSWHVKATYELTVAPGKQEKGTFEEWFYGPRSYKRVFTSDGLNQTDTATAKGLFRSGDQRWTTRGEDLIPTLLISPLSVHPYKPTQNELLDEPRTVGASKMRCVFVLRKPERDERAGANLGTDLNRVPSYCFEPDSSILRYGSRGSGNEVLFMNHILRFGNRYVAKEVEMTSGGKPLLTIAITALGALAEGSAGPDVAEGSIGPLGGRIVLPEGRLLPDLSHLPKMQGVDFRALVDAGDFSVKIVVGTDGHVKDVSVASGNPDKSALSLARQVVFNPFEILGTPVEVETTYRQGGSITTSLSDSPSRSRR